MTQAELLSYVQDQVRSGGAGGLTLASQVRDLLDEIINSIFAQMAADAATNAESLSGYVPQSGNYTINNVKTFTTLPQSTVIPVNGPDLVNKLYVDTEISDISGSIDNSFDSTPPIKRQVVGLENVVLGQSTIKATLQALLYPTKTPSGSLTGPAFHLYGDNTSVPLSYTLVKTDQPITSASVNGVTISVGAGDSQSGTVYVPNNPSGNTLFTLTITAAGIVYTTTFTSLVINPFYVGQSAKDNVTTPLLNADVNSLAQCTSNSSVMINVLANKYLVIALPASNNAPFTINGVTNNNFTITNITLTNIFGNSASYVLYVSKYYATGNDIVSFLSPKTI